MLEPAAIAVILNRHRFIVVPSKWKEPFGIVALEGLASGCVPIVSRRGGLVEAIGSHGYVFENGDASELADLLEVVLRDQEKASGRLNGVADHLARFTGRRVAEDYLTVFETLCA